MDLVVGGGVGGLVMAVLLAEQHHRPVHVVEAAPAVGGLLRSAEPEPDLVFDQGTHLLATTGHAQVDELLLSLLPEDEWHVLGGARRDLAGVWYADRLQEHSVYPDVRALGADRLARVRGSVDCAVTADEPFAGASAREVLTAWFGDAAWDEVHEPLLRHVYNADPDVLGPFAARITSLERVVLDDAARWGERAQDTAYRSRVAFPEQRHLPEHLASDTVAFYPRRGGMQAAVDALVARAQAAGVRIDVSSTVQRVTEDAGRLVVEIECGTGRETVAADHLFCTSGPVVAARLLGLELPAAPRVPRRSTVLVHLAADRVPDPDLYYAYDYAAGSDVFRVTNYAAFCPTSVGRAGAPLTVEMLLDPVDSGDDASVADAAVVALERMGFARRPRVVAVQRLAAGLPTPTIDGDGWLTEVRDRTRAAAPPRFVVSGIQAEAGLFFQRDVLVHGARLVARATEGDT